MAKGFADSFLTAFYAVQKQRELTRQFNAELALRQQESSALQDYRSKQLGISQQQLELDKEREKRLSQPEPIPEKLQLFGGISEGILGVKTKGSEIMGVQQITAAKPKAKELKYTRETITDDAGNKYNVRYDESGNMVDKTQILEGNKVGGATTDKGGLTSSQATRLSNISTSEDIVKRFEEGSEITEKEKDEALAKIKGETDALIIESGLSNTADFIWQLTTPEKGYAPITFNEALMAENNERKNNGEPELTKQQEKVLERVFRARKMETFK